MKYAVVLALAAAATASYLPPQEEVPSVPATEVAPTDAYTEAVPTDVVPTDVASEAPTDVVPTDAETAVEEPTGAEEEPSYGKTPPTKNTCE